MDPSDFPSRSGPPSSNPFIVIGESLLELYDIQMKQIVESQKISKIWIDGSKGVDAIYDVDDDDEGKIPIGESLSLTGPSIFSEVSTYPLVIHFGDLSWHFCVDYHCFYNDPPSTLPTAYPSMESIAWNTPTTMTVVSKLGSEATIRFEVIKDAAIAHLEFQFVDDDKEHQVQIEIKDGVISATHDGKEDTRRMIRQFGHRKNVQKRKTKDNLIDITKQPLSLDRFAFAVPLDGVLNVSVELTYDEVKGDLTVERRIKGIIDCKVPEVIQTNPVVNERWFSNLDGDGPKLRLKVSWFDPFQDTFCLSFSGQQRL